MTSNTYVIADLHGRNDLLKIALARLENKRPGRVIFTGDYIDRGPDSRKIIQRLADGPRLASWQWVCLLGNHEDMLIQALLNHKNIGRWLDNGGDATLGSYNQTSAEFASVGLLDRGHVDWIRSLPLYFQDEYRIYVHAGVDPDLPLEAQSRETLLWKRYGSGVDRGLGSRHVVHGHNPVEGGPLLLTHRSDFDTGAFFSDRLVVGVFDDVVPGGPVELIECLS